MPESHHIPLAAMLRHTSIAIDDVKAQPDVNATYARKLAPASFIENTSGA
jgi:hypothetical protein